MGPPLLSIGFVVVVIVVTCMLLMMMEWALANADALTLLWIIIIIIIMENSGLFFRLLRRWVKMLLASGVTRLVRGVGLLYILQGKRISTKVFNSGRICFATVGNFQ